MSRRVAILQPYVPQYRVPFFAMLTEHLRSVQVNCRVFAPSTAPGEQARRGDAAPQQPWLTTTRGRTIGLGGRQLSYLACRDAIRGSDAVIAPAAGSCMDTHLALLERRRRGLRVGLWGHIHSFVTPPSRVDALIERWQLTHCDQVFAYTPRGSQAARAIGVSPQKITTVMNTIDVEALTAARSRLSQSEIDEFARCYGLTNKRVLLFIGGLDASKRPEFLATVLDHLWSRDQSIRLLVCGEGVGSNALSDASERGQALILGRADDSLKVLAASVSEAILMPGRIGLVAVDALTLGIPVVTTANFKYHAPEVEYLNIGTSLLQAPDNSSEFADFLLSSRIRTRTHQEALGTPPTLTEMVERFATGVVTMLD